MFDKWQKNKEDAAADINGMQGGSVLTLEQAQPITQSIINKLGYPYQIFSSKASYKEVMDAYEKAVVQGQQEGFTPVIVPTDSTLDEYLGIVEDDGYSLEAVLKSELESGEEVLKQRFEEYTGSEEDGFNMEEFIGEFDEDLMAVESYSAFEDYRSGEIVETILFKVPTTKPWELVAYVPFGGWNECPEVVKMMAICKYWFEKYGAIPVTITHGVMEMRIPAPVAEQDSLQVAREHYAFTPDRVDQCTRTGTLSELAACIAASKIWYFWWD
ncbi:MAG: DUF4253 domain-containing protein [Lachnospiraceae bacterium]|nr:DUF4253 domain-containing protein [Lachnospiraceae bacterium]